MINCDFNGKFYAQYHSFIGKIKIYRYFDANESLLLEANDPDILSEGFDILRNKIEEEFEVKLKTKLGRLVYGS